MSMIIHRILPATARKNLRAEALAARTNNVPASTTTTNVPTKPRKPILEPPPPPTNAAPAKSAP